ncbi:unnamed protein product [Lupinus luteus]|uniref:Uncharacterized protein n=1 Tax=Lupinus luteus TaxID=3873 RepID=A0AAV1WU88_LUPLU
MVQMFKCSRNVEDTCMWANHHAKEFEGRVNVGGLVGVVGSGLEALSEEVGRSVGLLEERERVGSGTGLEDVVIGGLFSAISVEDIVRTVAVTAGSGPGVRVVGDGGLGSGLGESAKVEFGDVGIDFRTHFQLQATADTTEVATTFPAVSVQVVGGGVSGFGDGVRVNCGSSDAGIENSTVVLGARRPGSVVVPRLGARNFKKCSSQIENQGCKTVRNQGGAEA